MRITLIIIALFLSLISCKNNTTPDIAEYVSEADIVRNCVDSAAVELYLGNGRMGASFSKFGLHGANNGYTHIAHYARGDKNGADCMLKFIQVDWENNPVEFTDYKQYQSLFDGIVTTEWKTEQSEINVKSWIDMSKKDMACFEIDADGEVADIIIRVPDKIVMYYDQEAYFDKSMDISGNIIKVVLKGESVDTEVYFQTNAPFEIRNDEITIHPIQGVTNIITSVNSPITKSATESLSDSKEQWHKLWDESGIIMFPDEQMHKAWVRLYAQVLFSTNDDKLGLPAPCGLSGNAWPFSFPQDISFIHPILLSTGHLDMAKAWVEYFAERDKQMRDYTRRFLKVDGIYCPWGYSLGDMDETFHSPDVPNKYYFGIHNSGYLARMAHETAVMNNDSDWTQRYVIPLIEGTAQFYRNISKKGDDGYWHIHVEPSLGQDEFGGENQEDYLCALFSAAYCFKRAIEYGLDNDGKYEEILNGLAFPVLKNKDGFFLPAKSRGEYDLGRQKHPVQLNDLAFLPLDTVLRNESLKAYAMRYDITGGAKECLFPGWTLGEFLLAGSRVGDVQGWESDFAKLYSCSDLTDKEAIQIYESYGNYAAAYYTTTNGLVLQSLQNNVVSDWLGELSIGKCKVWDGAVYLKNICSILGVKINGCVTDESAEIDLEALRDCDFKINGRPVTMKKGEKRKLTIDLND